ncbi:Conserved oligomeric Golgi complex subunit 8 (COG8) [Paratrimastix pyriformis]|uniref:Conserved oligomeric Golgi complex subunit 8 n=1 Tax=Paratrimastix pyriformis TaxID=342808 RepID=A0ABQ8U977_9EUKA|nr:Conserved oligomeric Golgi complex subunit 8 (COG8) [Paratrimastix pyriformis]
MIHLSLSDLEEKPNELRRHEIELQDRLHALALTNCHSFLSVDSSLRKVAASASRVKGILDAVAQHHLPESATTLSAFPERAQTLLNEQKLARVMQNHAGILNQLLALPALLQSCYEQQYWEGCFDLISFVDQLNRRFPRTRTVGHLRQVCVRHARRLNGTLLALLGQGIRPSASTTLEIATTAGTTGSTKALLAETLRVVGLLRRLSLCTENEIRATFLAGQTGHLRQAATDLLGGNPNVPRMSLRPTAAALLINLAEVLRCHVRDTVTVYTALFTHGGRALPTALQASRMLFPRLGPAEPVPTAESMAARVAVPPSWTRMTSTMRPELLDQEVDTPPDDDGGEGASGDPDEELLRCYREWAAMVATAAGAGAGPDGGCPPGGSSAIVLSAFPSAPASSPSLARAGGGGRAGELDLVNNPLSFEALLAALATDAHDSAPSAAATPAAAQQQQQHGSPWEWCSFMEDPQQQQQQQSAQSVPTVGSLGPVEWFLDDGDLLADPLLSAASLLGGPLTARAAAGAQGQNGAADGHLLHQWLQGHTLAYLDLLARAVGPTANDQGTATILQGLEPLVRCLPAATITPAQQPLPWWAPDEAAEGALRAQLGDITRAMEPAELGDLIATLRHCGATLGRVGADWAAHLEPVLVLAAGGAWSRGLRAASAQYATVLGHAGWELPPAMAAEAGMAMTMGMNLSMPPLVQQFGPLKALAQGCLAALSELRSTTAAILSLLPPAGPGLPGASSTLSLLCDACLGALEASLHQAASQLLVEACRVAAVAPPPPEALLQLQGDDRPGVMETAAALAEALPAFEPMVQQDEASPQPQPPQPQPHHDEPASPQQEGQQQEGHGGAGSEQHRHQDQPAQSLDHQESEAAAEPPAATTAPPNPAESTEPAP